MSPDSPRFLQVMIITFPLVRQTKKTEEIGKLPTSRVIQEDININTLPHMTFGEVSQPPTRSLHLWPVVGSNTTQLVCKFVV